MFIEHHVEIRPAANGYVVFYSELRNNTETTVEFVALSLDETLEIVRDLFSQEESSANLANIVEETIPQK
jgi:molybdopterin converting factor small subunit